MNRSGHEHPCWKALTEWMAGTRAATLVRNRLFHYYLALAHSYLPVAILCGPTRPHGRPGTLLVAGKKPWADHLPDLFFAGRTRSEELGRFPIWTLAANLERLQSSVDLTIVRVNEVSARLFFDKRFLRVPEQIGAWLTVPEDPQVLLHASESVRSDLRKIRRNQMEALFSREESDFEEFYRRMYLPYIRARHGKLAYGANWYRLRRQFRRGGVLWVHRAGKRLAGAILVRQQQLLSAVAMGTDHGDLALMKQGALAAIYYSTIEYAHRQGCALISLGMNRSLLQDGILRYKRKWGAVFTESSDSSFDLLLRWNRFDGVVADFLSHTSPVFREPGGISAIHVVSFDRPATSADAQQIHRSLWIDGLQRLYLVSTAGWEPAAKSPPHTILMNVHEAEQFPFCKDMPSKS